MLTNEPQVSSKTLSEVTGYAKSTISEHVHHLIDLNLARITLSKEGNFKVELLERDASLNLFPPSFRRATEISSETLRILGFLDEIQVLFSENHARESQHGTEFRQPSDSSNLLFLFVVLLILPGILFQEDSSATALPSKIRILSVSPTATAANAIKQFPIPTANSGPNAIIAAPNNTFWFVEFTAGKLGEFFAQNASFKEFPIPENHSIPASLAIDILEKIWFSDQSSPGQHLELRSY